jgi:DNA-binding PadR family transcriptional regulator
MSIINKKIQTKLTKGLLDLIILQLLENHPMHGYEIIASIRKNFGIHFGPSTIYPLLGMIEKKNYIKGQWNTRTDRPRKVYSLTDDGKRMLDYATGTLRAICKNMATENVQTNDRLQRQIQMTTQRPSFQEPIK